MISQNLSTVFISFLLIFLLFFLITFYMNSHFSDCHLMENDSYLTGRQIRHLFITHLGQTDLSLRYLMIKERTE